jgi:hypothetical protein
LWDNIDQATVPTSKIPTTSPTKRVMTRVARGRGGVVARGDASGRSDMVQG